MSPNVRLLLAVFAVFRLARLIASEEGPGGILEALRVKAGAADYGADGQPTSNLARGITCPYCVGVYAAALVALAVVKPTRAGDALLTWLGVAGAQSALEDAAAGWGTLPE